MLDFDLAALYAVETRTLNQSVKRNIERFPSDFMFQLTAAEWDFISSQFVMTSRMKRPKHFYTPGAVTAWLELVISILMISYLIKNNLGDWQDYVFGPIIMFVCFGMLQKTMTLMVGFNYSDMPKMIKRQWSGK